MSDADLAIERVMPHRDGSLGSVGKHMVAPWRAHVPVGRLLAALQLLLRQEKPLRRMIGIGKIQAWQCPWA